MAGDFNNITNMPFFAVNFTHFQKKKKRKGNELTGKVSFTRVHKEINYVANQLTK